MTVVTDLRKRLASTLRLRLGHAGMTVSATVASSLAGEALKSANVEALTGYVAAVEAGTDPAAVRDILIGDPAIGPIMITAPEP